MQLYLRVVAHYPSDRMERLEEIWQFYERIPGVDQRVLIKM